MKTSTNRILTTHTGSLPRPPVLRELLVAKDKAEPYDAAALARLTREAVFATVRRQAEVGVDSSTTARCRSRAIRPMSPTA